MGFAYRCDAELACTFIVFDDDLTPDQRNEHERELFADPEFPPGSAILLDLSTVTNLTGFTTEAISEIGLGWRAHALHLGPMRVAIIATGVWEEARQFGDDVEGSGIRVLVFDASGTAWAWLGVDASRANSILNEVRQRARA
jgi:hypothetical protein